MKNPYSQGAILILWIGMLTVSCAVYASAEGRDGLGTGKVGTEMSGRRSEGAEPVLARQKEVAMTGTNRLTEEEGRQLLSEARKTIEAALFDQKAEKIPDSSVSDKFSQRRGTFVTLTIDHNLRGCIGHIIPQETLIEGVRLNALNAAFRDPRFRPLSKKEWARVKIEVSVLTDPQELPYKDAQDLLEKLRPGVDGVILNKGYHQATFLPQVWDQLPDKRDFLTHLCMKAGLDGDAWKKEELAVQIYQVQAFEE